MSTGKPLSKKEYAALKFYKKLIQSEKQKRVIAPYVVTKKDKIKKKAPEESYFEFYAAQKKPSLLLQNLTQYFAGEVSLPTLLHETSEVVKTTTKASASRIYLIDDTKTEIYLSTEIDSRHKVNYKIEEGATVAAYVAHTKEYLMIEDIVDNPNFPDGIGYIDSVKSVLCIPIISPETQDCIAVMELTKRGDEPPFTKDDLKIVVVVTGWMGAAIYQNQQRMELEKQKELNDYLISLTKCYFAYSVDLEKMISEIIQFAKATIGAERGSFYIIERQKDEMFADYYDEGIEDDGTLHKKNMKFHIGKDKGIAATVAFTGEIINLKDAYKDSRFNKEYDQRTGYITRTMLCMPIKGIEGILGVLQLVNKVSGGCFTATDEYILETFAVYSALALHFSKVMNELTTIRKLNEINRGLAKYHLKPCSHDTDFFYSHTVNIPISVSEFSFYITRDLLEYMPHIVSYMILDLIDSHEIDIDNLMSFMLIVRNGYRNNSYHNYEHAFTVMNCMYNLLLRNLDVFCDLEIKALLVATICHDLDHRGFTNNFLILTNDMLAQMYEESPLENHHVYMTMLILEDLNLFPTMDSETYHEYCKEIREAIIATDLALYFKVRMKLSQICNEGFDWNILLHRDLGKELMMTACDLSAMCKPFGPAKMVTEYLYIEFYHQGDIEKSMDLMPLSMMDREKRHLMPEDQVQFLTVVVLPCNELLKKILPNSRELYDGCAKLRDAWKEIIEMRGQKVWKQNESVVKK